MSRLPASSELSAVQGIFSTSTTYYLALFTTDPGTTGSGGEVSGGSYARQQITFATNTNELWSSGTYASQSFASMPAEASGIPYFGIFTTLTGSVYLGGGTTSGLSGSIPAGATVSFATNAVVLAIS